jgi:hypothetical protein
VLCVEVFTITSVQLKLIMTKVIPVTHGDISNVSIWCVCVCVCVCFGIAWWGGSCAPIRGSLTHMTCVTLGEMEGESALNHLYFLYLFFGGCGRRGVEGERGMFFNTT